MLSADAVKRLADKNTITVAQREMDWVLWKFGDDIHDISDGPNPVGDRITEVHGIELAIKTVKLMMRRDPGIRFVHIVPKRLADVDVGLDHSLFYNLPDHPRQPPAHQKDYDSPQGFQSVLGQVTIDCL